ncbi:DNA internalization-related competence protein ComEC/Rec2 [Humidesulfovibrio idahonensis]
MQDSQRQNPGPGVTPPGLLAWQVYFLAYVAGIWGMRHPEPAFCVAALLGIGLAAFRRPGLWRSLASLCLVAACFAGGLAHARLALPTVPALPPLVAQSQTRALVQARVAEVTDKTYGRLEIVLEDARATFTPKPDKGADNVPQADDTTFADSTPANSTQAQPQTVAVPGRIAWDWDEPGYRPAPGQRVEVELRLRPVHGFANLGGADFEWQQRLRGVFVRTYSRGADIEATWGARPAAFWWDLRENLRGTLLSHLPQTQGAAIVLGLLLGDRSRIDQNVTDELRAAGLSHTLALSGLNVVYVAVLGLGLAWLVGLAWPRLFLRIPRQKLAILFSFPLVAAYVWVGQASPSLVRSAWMFGFWGLLLLFDRGRALVDGLFLALLLIIGLDPLSVFDVSLEMSAVAVAGMALLYPWFAAFVPRPRGWLLRPLHWAWDALALTLCANLALLPVTVWYFGTYPPNFLLNLPWLPVQGLVVQVLGMVGLGLAPVPGLSGVAGALLGWASWVQDWMLVGLHRLVAAGLFPTWALLRPLWPELLGAAAVLAAAPFCWPRPRTQALVLLLGGLLLMAWPQAEMLRDEARDEVRLTVFDVGQAQALLVSAPGGRRVLVDAGGSMSRTFDMGRSVVGPALCWGRPPRLEAALFSHPDSDHAQGLAWIVRQFRVGRFLTNGQWPEGALADELAAALKDGVSGGRLAPEVLAAGQTLDLGSGVVLEALHPAEDYQGRGTNDNSLVLRLVWRGVPLAILPGDVQQDGIEDMIAHGRNLRAQVLVLPHHGSKSSLSGMLYEAVAPMQALVSCGFQNQYHFPNKDVVAELALHAIPLQATPERGMMELVWRAPGGGFSLRGARP